MVRNNFSAITYLIFDHVNNSAAGPVYGFHIFAHIKQYEGGLSISLSAVISMQPLGIEQANNPYMKAKDVPFHMGYGGLICSTGIGKSTNPRF